MIYSRPKKKKSLSWGMLKRMNHRYWRHQDQTTLDLNPALLVLCCQCFGNPHRFQYSYVRIRSAVEIKSFAYPKLLGIENFGRPRGIFPTTKIEDGWNIFTKTVPKTTSMRGIAAQRNCKYFFVFPKCFITKRTARMIDPITKGG